MGKFIRKIILLFIIVLGSCKNKESYEYIFYTIDEYNEVSFYQTILRQEKGMHVKQVRYTGSFINYESFSPEYTFPDSAMRGRLKIGNIAFMRTNNTYYKYKFNKDTATICNCSEILIPFKSPLRINLLDKIFEDDNHYLRLNNQGIDTTFNNVLPVMLYNKYQYRDNLDFLDIYIDLERKMMIKYYSRKSSATDSRDAFYEIISFRKVSNNYFNELWKKAKYEDFLNCSPY